MGTTLVTQAGGNSDIQEYSKTIVYTTGNSNQLAQEVKTLLHISGREGLLFDAANGAFTNGSTGVKTVLDYNGTYKNTKTNEIRYANAQRVQNYLTDNQNLQNASAWNPVFQQNISVTTGIADPFGGTRAITVTATATAGQFSSASLTLPLTQYANIVCYIKRRTGTGSILYQRPDGGTYDHVIYVTDEWLPVHRPSDDIATTGRWGFRVSVSGDAVDVCLPMWTDVYGNANKRSFMPIDNSATSQIYNSGIRGTKYLNTYQPFATINVWGDSIPGAASPLTWGIRIQQLWGSLTYKSVGGETSTQTLARIQAATDLATTINILWTGTNNLQAEPETVIADNEAAIALFIAANPNARWAIISCLNGNGDAQHWAPSGAFYTNMLAVNAYFKAAYPENYIEVREAAVAAYNPLDAQDIIDFGHDTVPTSLRSDTIHPNSTFNINIALPIIYNHLLSKGLLNDIDITPSIIHEPATDNLALLPRDLTNAAWVKTNCTAAKTARGTDGILNAASVLTADANDATCLQSITSASANRVTGFFLKRVTGTGQISITQDNGTTWTPVTITTAWTALPYTLPAATLADPTFGIKIAASGDVIHVDWAQHELGSYITSPISGARTIDSIKVPLSANVNFPQTKGIAFIKVTPQFANSATAKSLLCTSSAATDFVHDNGSGEIAINDGTNTATTSGLGGWAVGDILLIAAIWIIDTMSIHVSKNGGAWVDSANATYDGAFPAGANLLLCNANTDSILINSIKIKSTTKSLADAQAWAKASAIYEAI
jgi:hypothetical protein